MDGLMGKLGRGRDSGSVSPRLSSLFCLLVRI